MASTSMSMLVLQSGQERFRPSHSSMQPAGMKEVCGVVMND
jgi:hypothetical protein